jgi:hypothetical protein
MMRKHQRATSKKAGISVILLALLGFAVWGLRPPLEVYPYEGKVIVDVQTLGEYNSSLSSLELAECESGNVVWRLEPSTDPIELWAFPLQVGLNPSIPAEVLSGSISEERLVTAELRPVGKQADFRAVIPFNLSNFSLRSGTCYQIKITPTSRFKQLFQVSETFML